ncbi:MAG: hypothetical protein U1C96_01930 [Gallionella sp.]|nr:hypothetical protein [Gallionella sp.]
MPRRPRVNLTGHPLHVVQCGHNREACFFADEDFLFWEYQADHRCCCDVIHVYSMALQMPVIICAPLEFCTGCHPCPALTAASPTASSRGQSAVATLRLFRGNPQVNKRVPGMVDSVRA